MATQVKHRRGIQSEIDNFTPAIAEIVVNTSEAELVVGDGASQGGIPVPKKTKTFLHYQDLASVLADGSLKNGYSLQLRERTAGSGNGGVWDVVLTSTVTPNGRNIVQSIAQPTLSIVLRTTEVKNLTQHGVPDQVDDTALLQDVVDTLNESDTLDLNGKTVVIETVNITQDHVTIRNGKIVAKSSLEGVMLYITGDGVTIKDMKSYIDSAGSSVSKGTITFKQVTGGLVTNCKFEGGRRSGPNNEVANMVGVFQSSRVVIANNIMFEAAFVEMVQLDSCTDCVVQGNTISSTGNAYSAIATTDTYGIGGDSNHVISGNTCKTFRTSVLTINTGAVSIVGNSIDGSSEEQGINLGHTGTGAPDCTVSGNTITNCAGAGVALAEASNTAVVGNVIRYCGEAGIDTSSTVEALIADNFIHNIGNATTGNGIKLSTGVAASYSIRGNKFKTIKGNGIEVNGAVVKLVVTGNHFTDINTAGFSGGRFPVKGSLNVGIPCELIVFENNVVDGNFTTNRCVSVDNSNANIIMVLANNVLPAITTTAELWKANSGAQPSNRVIQRNKMGNDPMTGAATMVGGTDTIVVNNSNQTPYNPPILIIRDNDAAQAQIYVESFSTGTFTIKGRISAPFDAIIGYEIV